MIVFGQSGCIRVDLVFVRVKLVVFRRKWLYSAKWLYSGKSSSIIEKWLNSGKFAYSGKN